MSVRASVSVQGVEKLVAQLRSISEKDARKAVKQGTGDWARMATKVAKKMLNKLDAVDTKTLRKSLGYKVRSYEKGALQYGIVGARRDVKASGRRKEKRFSRDVGRGKKGVSRRRQGNRKLQRIVPGNYIHLVELGTREHALGKGSRLLRSDGKNGSKNRTQTGRRHPGTKAKAFLARTRRITARYAEQFIERRVRNALAKYR